ncbi:hypothetical protein FRZ03_27945 [Streptomyces misionensis]|uniref:Uncharacterized protein n=1 Tax=Streptomyces misionensis TaxID=67331 RepID=A0A5C6J1V2_9ACTN|nr:hypothetical protein [Streptomyces misionensis]TWV34713.1 hypothetical protein FRZ03_27945 [Streptomyces misionensis]
MSALIAMKPGERESGPSPRGGLLEAVDPAHAIQEVRENRELRRNCYTQLHWNAGQFTTALSRHLYVMRDRTPEQEDVSALWLYR